MTHVLILGASSAMAVECARLMAKRGDSFTLVARDRSRLDITGADLTARGAAAVRVIEADLAETARHGVIVDQAFQKEGFDIVLLAYGVLGDQRAAERDPHQAAAILAVNYNSAVSLLLRCAERMEQAGKGSIAVISSVAGDRGRQSNYLYGSAKAGLNCFLQGLRNRLAPKGVQVLTVKPGFVDTPMTAGMKKGPLFVGPERVARDIVKAIGGSRNVIYTPWFWLPIMLIIRSIPEFIFKRMKL